MQEFYETLIAPEVDKLDALLDAWDIPYIELQDCAHTKVTVIDQFLICDSCDDILEDQDQNQLIQWEYTNGL